jgi:hypothetical protein
VRGARGRAARRRAARAAPRAVERAVRPEPELRGPRSARAARRLAHPWRADSAPNAQRLPGASPSCPARPALGPRWGRADLCPSCRAGAGARVPSSCPPRRGSRDRRGARATRRRAAPPRRPRRRAARRPPRQAARAPARARLQAQATAARTRRAGAQARPARTQATTHRRRTRLTEASRCISCVSWSAMVTSLRRRCTRRSWRGMGRRRSESSTPSTRGHGRSRQGGAVRRSGGGGGRPGGRRISVGFGAVWSGGGPRATRWKRRRAAPSRARANPAGFVVVSLT